MSYDGRDVSGACGGGPPFCDTTSPRRSRPARGRALTPLRRARRGGPKTCPDRPAHLPFEVGRQLLACALSWP